MKRFGILALLALVGASFSTPQTRAGQSSGQIPRYTQSCVGFIAVTGASRHRGLAEYPATDQEYAHGMKHRQSISDDEFMIFNMFGDIQPSLWMHETPHPLDILFIDQNSTVAFIAEHTRPLSKEHIRPDTKAPISYAMEMRAGLARELGFKVGATRIHVAPPTYCPAHIGG